MPIKMVGADAVIAQMDGKSLKGKVQAAVRVGYKAPYAIYVHENLQISHPKHGDRSCGGGARFLARAVNYCAKEMRAMVARSVKAKNGLIEGLTRAGEYLKVEAQKRTPVLTGRLRDSAYVIVE